METQMNKKLLCTAVGTAVGLGIGLPAQADFDDQETYALVPYVVKDTNRTTLVTLIGDPDSLTGAQRLHLQYWTKSTTDANTAACQPSSVTITWTPNDIVTFDTAGILGYPLFGDTTNPAPLGLAIAFAAPRHGYLIAEALDDREIQAAYWLELDLGNGGARGDYVSVDSTTDVSSNFEDNEVLERDTNSGSLSYATAVNFWPSSVASQYFTVTPLGTDMVNRENNQVVTQVFNTNSVQGAYDRNENGVDGTVPITVRCVGRVTPAQLMPGVVANAAWAAQGGWGWLANLGDGDSNGNETQNATNSGDLDAMVYQVDSATAAGRFLLNSVRIKSDRN